MKATVTPEAERAVDDIARRHGRRKARRAFIAVEGEFHRCSGR